MADVLRKSQKIIGKVVTLSLSSWAESGITMGKDAIYSLDRNDIKVIEEVGSKEDQ